MSKGYSYKKISIGDPREYKINISEIIRKHFDLEVLLDYWDQVPILEPDFYDDRDLSWRGYEFPLKFQNNTILKDKKFLITDHDPDYEKLFAYSYHYYTEQYIFGVSIKKSDISPIGVYIIAKEINDYLSISIRDIRKELGKELRERDEHIEKLYEEINLLKEQLFYIAGSSIYLEAKKDFEANLKGEISK